MSRILQCFRSQKCAVVHEEHPTLYQWPSNQMPMDMAQASAQAHRGASHKLYQLQTHASRMAPRVRATRTAFAPRATDTQMSTGLYFSTSTGNTETVAGYIAEAAGLEDPEDIGDAEDSDVLGHDGIICGAPTWHTGADSERSGTAWDEWLYQTLPDMDLSGKKVAIFGVGDSAGYADNFCDATGELYDQLTAKGAKVYGMTPSDSGFDYTDSKSVRDGKFVGCVFDEDNYPDESEERAAAWVEQLKSEGFM